MYACIITSPFGKRQTVSLFTQIYYNRLISDLFLFQNREYVTKLLIPIAVAHKQGAGRVCVQVLHQAVNTGGVGLGGYARAVAPHGVKAAGAKVVGNDAAAQGTTTFTSTRLRPATIHSVTSTVYGSA